MKFGRTLALTGVLFGSAVVVFPPAHAQQEVDPTYYPPVTEAAAPLQQRAPVVQKGKARVSTVAYHQQQLKPIAKKQATSAVNDQAKPPAGK